jgi:hypothetical protein
MKAQSRSLATAAILAGLRARCGEPATPIRAGADGRRGPPPDHPHMKRVLVASVFALLLLGAPAAAARVTHHITIRHQTVGCHAWSLDNGPFKARLTLAVRKGDVLEISNDDAMSHRLVQLAGPPVAVPAAMGESTFHHPGGGTVTLVLTKPGTYRFRTVDAEDGAKPLPTVGAENVLRLTVRVV